MYHLAERSGIPCGRCDFKQTCHVDVGALEFRSADEQDRVLAHFFEELRRMYAESGGVRFLTYGEANCAFADLCFTHFYIREAVSQQRVNLLYCGGRFFIPLVFSCPNCLDAAIRKTKLMTSESPTGAVLSKTRFKEVRFKPQSAKIGEYGVRVCKSILAQTQKNSLHPMQIHQIAAQNSDLDLVATSQECIFLWEVKSSPLLVLPLEVYCQEKGVIEPHAIVPLQNRKRFDAGIWLPHGRQIPLGTVTEDPSFPANRILKTFGEDSSTLHTYLELWAHVLRSYQKGAEETWYNYLRYGYGQVDDSKNAPGLDRTDDIKKATYQMLKDGAKYKVGCARGRVFVGLLGNLFSERHYAEYLRPVARADWRPPDSQRWISIYDAILGVNRNMLLESVQDWLSLEPLIGAERLKNLGKYVFSGLDANI